MELEVVVYDGMVDVIRFDDVLERARSLLWVLFNVVDGNAGKVDAGR